MSYSIKILNDTDFKTSSWPGGKTTEFAIYPSKSIYKNLDFIWRISSATVDLDESTFTILPNITRFITPLTGVLTLTHDNNNLITLTPFDIYKFSGDYTTKSFGKVRDFNLMIGKNALGFLNKEEITPTYKPLKIFSKKDSCNFKTLFKIFFSPFEDVNFILDDSKKIILRKNEVLLITLDNTFNYPNIKIASLNSNHTIFISSILC